MLTTLSVEPASFRDPALAEASGRIVIGPLRALDRAQIRACLTRHGLTTGNDSGLVLLADEAENLWLSASGPDVTGYLLESGSFGLEACEEAIEAFLRETAALGRTVRISGHFDPEATVKIASAASYQVDDAGLQQHARRERVAPHGRLTLLQLGSPLPQAPAKDRAEAQTAAPRQRHS